MKARRSATRRLLLLWLSTTTTTALKILVTNDDGFETANIQALFRALTAAGHEVLMSAPYAGQSGTGGQIAFLTPIAPTAAPSPQGTLPAGSPGVGPTTLSANQYYVDGSPAASVLYGLDVLAPLAWGTQKPDLVISGPNEGNNLGVVTPHSGTVGAAVTALNKGITAVAYSADNGDPTEADVVADLCVRLVAGFTKKPLPPGTGLNVNVPPIPANTSAADFDFFFSRLGTSANFGLQFFARLNESAVALGFGIPATLDLPGVSLAVPPSAAGYPDDPDPTSESNALGGDLIVTVSPIQGTYALDDLRSRETRAALEGLLLLDDDYYDGGGPPPVVDDDLLLLKPPSSYSYSYSYSYDGAFPSSKL